MAVRCPVSMSRQLSPRQLKKQNKKLSALKSPPLARFCACVPPHLFCSGSSSIFSFCQPSTSISLCVCVSARTKNNSKKLRTVKKKKTKICQFLLISGSKEDRLKGLRKNNILFDQFRVREENKKREKRALCCFY